MFRARCAAEGAACEMADLVLQGDPEACQHLLQHLLKAYQEECFQDACRKLNREWGRRLTPPSLVQKMEEIDSLTLKLVLCRILPTFGFHPDAQGAAKMKSAISKHVRAQSELRQLHVEV